MAKKRHLIKEEKEEEYEFTPSDFDEKEFILKDIYGTKVLLLTLVLAVVIGYINSLICNHMDSPLDYVLCTIIVFAFVLVMKKFYMAIGIRADLLESKTLLGDYFMFLVLALGVCIVFVNPPFA